MTQSIDVTGLPEPVVTGLQTLVAGLRGVFPVKPDEVLTPQERAAAWEALIARQKHTTVLADDSRASFYEGRDG